MNNYKEQLISGNYYHIYGRANGSEKLFLTEANYNYFLKRFSEYIVSIGEVYSYCLMPNHYHFVIKIKEEQVIENAFINNAKTKGKSLSLSGFQTLTGIKKQTNMSNFLSKQFSNFLNGYTQAFNKQINRKGSLFIRPFSRKKITSEQYLKEVIIYIHHNPVEAGLCENVDDWKFSSYNSIVKMNNALSLSGFETLTGIEELKSEEVILLFEDLENFINSHQQEILI